MKRKLLVANLVGWSLLALLGWSRLPPGTPLTDAAIERVRQEVAYTSAQAPDLPREYLVALAVNSYVVGHISAPVYLYRIDAGLPEPDVQTAVPVWVEHALSVGSGLCGTATLVALTLYDALDVRAREVRAFYLQPDGIWVSHYTTEVFYAGRWHWFEPLWGAFHRNGEDPASVYSLVQVVRMTPERQAATLVADASLLRSQVTQHTFDNPMAFTTYSPFRIEIDGHLLYRRSTYAATMR